MRMRKIVAVATVLAAGAALAACSSGGGGDSAKGNVNWWTWDPNQAAAYQTCIPEFEKENPGIKVKISQYNTDDYFTKLTAGFVGGNAPDAFMNSVQYFPSYAKQGQLLALDDRIKSSGYDTAANTIGNSAWKGKDGKTYGIPMDWATSGVYYNKKMVKDAGLTDSDVQNMSFNPSDGGTVEKIAAHLTVDTNGVRGDQPGFDKSHVAVYGIGPIANKDFRGQTSWFPFAAATGWTKDKPTAWPKYFDYSDQKFVKTMSWVKGLVAKGYSPGINDFSVAGTEALGSGKVAIIVGGSWEASTYAKLPGLEVGTAPSPVGEDGKTRGAFGNANGNVIWAGGKHLDATWKWVSYQESEKCQSKAAAFNASFFPSNGKAMNALVGKAKQDGIDLSVFVQMQKADQIQLSQPFENGTAVQTVLQPMFESYFTGEAGDEIWQQAQDASKRVIATGH